MPKLQKVLCHGFAGAAMIFALVAISTISTPLQAPVANSVDPLHDASSAANNFIVVFGAMRLLNVLFPLTAALLSASAWWTLRKGNPSAQRWAHAASISVFAMSLQFLFTGVALTQYHVANSIQAGGTLVLTAALLLLAISGLTTFGKRRANSGTASRLALIANEQPQRVF